MALADFAAGARGRSFAVGRHSLPGAAGVFAACVSVSGGASATVAPLCIALIAHGLHSVVEPHGPSRGVMRPSQRPGLSARDPVPLPCCDSGGIR